MKWIGITFGNSSNWGSAAKRLELEMKSTLVFDEIMIFNEENLELLSSEWSSLQPFVSNNARGYGYWIWKPLIFKELIEKYPEYGIVYFDAGCEINWNLLAKLRFRSYLNKCQENGILVFQMKHLENKWSKKDAVQLICEEQLNFPTGQISASVIFRAPSNKDFIFSDWYEISKRDNFHYLDDTPSFSLENKSFIEHRHDQSILSLLVKKNKVELFRDESHNPRFLPQTATPIWAIRNNQFEKMLPDYFKKAQNSWFGF